MIADSELSAIFLMVGKFLFILVILIQISKDKQYYNYYIFMKISVLHIPIFGVVVTSLPSVVSPAEETAKALLPIFL